MARSRYAAALGSIVSATLDPLNAASLGGGLVVKGIGGLSKAPVLAGMVAGGFDAGVSTLLFGLGTARIREIQGEENPLERALNGSAARHAGAFRPKIPASAALGLGCTVPRRRRPPWRATPSA